MDWDVLFDGSSIADKIISFDIIKGRGSFCKQFTLEVADYSLKSSIDLKTLPEEPLIEIRTNTGSGWSSEGTFFIERCSPNQSKDVITLTLWGRDESARLTQPFAKKMYKEYDEDTTLYEIVEEILTDCGLEYSSSRMLIDDFIIYANSYSVQGMYPLDVLRQLVSVTDGFLYTDRLGKLWVVKDEYHWDDVVTEIDGTVIASITEREDYPEFGKRVRVGSYADDGELDINISLQVEEMYVEVGEGVIAKAVVTRKDGTPVPDGYKVEWTTDNSNYATWERNETSITTHRITDEGQSATSRRLVSTDYPIRQVHSVTVVSTGEEIAVKSHEGTSITLDADLPFTDSAVIVDYSTGYATNTLIGGSTGEVEVDVHAIVETFVRDTQTIRIDTSSGDPTAEQAAHVTIVTRDFITEELITDPGEVSLDGSVIGETEDGSIDLGLIEGGDHDVGVEGVSGYQDTEGDGLANDEIRVGQTVYTLPDGEETTDPNLITEHNDLSNIQGGVSGQRYHLTAAELAALSTYSVIGHTHDSRYYTETELDGDQLQQYALLAGRSGDKLIIDEFESLDGQQKIQFNETADKISFFAKGELVGKMASGNWTLSSDAGSRYIVCTVGDVSDAGFRFQNTICQWRWASKGAPFSGYAMLVDHTNLKAPIAVLPNTPTNLLYMKPSAIGILETDPSAIVDVKQGAGNPIADAWDTHCLAKYKNVLGEVNDLDAVIEEFKAIPQQMWTHKAILGDHMKVRMVRKEVTREEALEPGQCRVLDGKKKATAFGLTPDGQVKRIEQRATKLVPAMVLKNNVEFDEKTGKFYAVVEENLSAEEIVKEEAKLGGEPRCKIPQYGPTAEEVPDHCKAYSKKDGTVIGINRTAQLDFYGAVIAGLLKRIEGLERKVQNV